MALHATLSPLSNIPPEAAARGRALTNSRTLTCSGCGLSTTAGPMALHRCDPGYVGVHLRLVRRRGSARSHACIDCGVGAGDWSYNYRDPNEVISEEGQRYSLHLENYDPRCRSCHLKHDQEKDPALAASRINAGRALASSGAGARATARKWGR